MVFWVQQLKEKEKLDKLNALPSDGSFMELFMKKQAEEAAKKASGKEEETESKPTEDKDSKEGGANDNTAGCDDAR